MVVYSSIRVAFVPSFRIYHHHHYGGLLFSIYDSALVVAQDFWGSEIIYWYSTRRNHCLKYYFHRIEKNCHLIITTVLEWLGLFSVRSVSLGRHSRERNPVPVNWTNDWWSDEAKNCDRKTQRLWNIMEKRFKKSSPSLNGTIVNREGVRFLLYFSPSSYHHS